MIDHLKPYSKMKDSGVPWLGEVLEHWEVQRLCHAAEIRADILALGLETKGLLGQIVGGGT